MRGRRGAGGVVHVRGCARARFGLPLESVRVQMPSDQVDLGPCRLSGLAPAPALLRPAPATVHELGAGAAWCAASG